MHKKFKAFTLVELIVVITILAILGTIGFISLQGYSVNARDSVRISDTKTFLKALNIYQTKNGEVPLPDDMTTITGSGVVFSYQGTLSGSVITQLRQGQVPVDPLLGTPYLYATNEGRTKVQLLSYHEKNTSSLEIQNTLTYAETTYADMFPKVIGDEVGILVNEDNTPVGSGSYDESSFTGGEKLYFSQDLLVSNQNDLRNILITGNESSCLGVLARYPSAESGNFYIQTGNSHFRVYCDMETDGGGWTRVVHEDYEEAVSGWTNNTITTCGTYGNILGGYNVLGGNTLNEKTFSLMNIPHQEVKVSLDYITIDSWDTDEDPVFQIDATDYPMDEDYVLTYAEDKTQICGSMDDLWNELKFPISKAQSHSGNDVTILVSSTLDSEPFDESYGHDNLEIYVR